MQDRPPALPRWVREITGVAVAVALALVVVGSIAASDRSQLLFRDGDSLLTILFARSLEVGQTQDWAMSTVLFIPELLVFCALRAFGAGVEGSLVINAVVNLVALYGALRFAAGTRSRAPVAGALLALAAFAALAVCDTSASRDALELASLQTTTTYYSATVVGCVLAVACGRRSLERESGWRPVAGLAAVSAVSVLSNPLFAAWATVPLAAVVIAISRRRRAWIVVGTLFGGAALGALARLPFADVIANTGTEYADPSQWLASLGYYARLIGERAVTPTGAAALVLTVALLVVAVVLTIRSRGDEGALVVTAYSWAAPALVVIGAIALGTHAARYLQPVAFAASLALVVVPGLIRVHVPRVVVAIGVLAIVVTGVASIPRITHAASAPDADLSCVTTWTDASHRTGAGQFWTIRLPKAHVADPRTLVQVDHRLGAYAWIVNRDDFSVGSVTFLVLDDQSLAFELPAGVSASDARVISCGRYTILDFGDRALPLGPQRS